MEVSSKRMDIDHKTTSLDKSCELCEIDSGNKAASGFCKECDQFMCKPCFRQHLRVKSCRHHTLFDTNASAEEMARSNTSALKCKHHETETVKYYCRTHEAVGCGDCLRRKHNSCRTGFIKNVSVNFQQNEVYKTFMKKVEHQMHETRQFEKKIDENKKDNKLMLEKALSDIKQFRLDINKYLDKVETDITCQVKNVMDKNDTLLSKLEKDCTMLSANLEEITDMLNRELYNDIVLFVHTVECKSKVPEIDRAILDMKSRSMNKYEFVCDQKLQSLVTSSQKFGTLAISNEKVKSRVAVGGRVKHNSPYWASYYGEGTITDVHGDGKVTVKWSSGDSRRYRIGLSVSLI